MTHDDGVIVAGHHKDTGHYPVEDRSGIGSRSGLNINTTVAGTHIFQFRMLLLTKGSDHGITSGHRIGQLSSITTEIIR